MIIGCLPTYSIGPYTAGIAAPILLTIMRLLQVRACLWGGRCIQGRNALGGCLPAGRPAGLRAHCGGS